MTGFARIKNKLQKEKCFSNLRVIIFIQAAIWPSTLFSIQMHTYATNIPTLSMRTLVHRRDGWESGSRARWDGASPRRARTSPRRRRCLVAAATRTAAATSTARPSRTRASAPRRRPRTAPRRRYRGPRARGPCSTRPRTSSGTSSMSYTGRACGSERRSRVFKVGRDAFFLGLYVMLGFSDRCTFFWNIVIRIFINQCMVLKNLLYFYVKYELCISCRSRSIGQKFCRSCLSISGRGMIFNGTYSVTFVERNKILV